MLFRLLIFVTLMTGSTAVFSQQSMRIVGDYVQVGLPLVALSATLIDNDRAGSIQLLKSFAVQTGTTIFLKRVINRKRPNGKNYSFPSGHTSLSFMGSTFIWKRYGWRYGVPASLAAAFVGYSRAGIDDPRHHVSDVFAGAAVGIISSLLFTKSKRATHKIEVIGDAGFVGFSYQYNFSRS